MVLDQVAHTLDDTTAVCGAAQHVQREERNRQTADQQADTVYRIGYRNGFQAAEDGIDRADHADSNT